MEEKDLLGLPLEEALDMLRARGVAPVRVHTCAAPRRASQARISRVVRVRAGGRELTVATFMDEEPGGLDAHNDSGTERV